MAQTRRLAVGITAVIAMVAGVIAAKVMAGPEQIAFPKDYAKWQKYGMVDRHDTKQYREFYARPEVVRAVREGKPIPDGAVLVMEINAAQLDDKGAPVKDAKGRFVKGKPIGVTVMEKRAGWGAAVPEAWRNGKANANIKACFDCHKPHERQDYVISLASLSGTAPGAVAKPSGPGIVSIAEFLFGPQKITVKAGQTITWTNVDDSPHQVTVQGESTLRTPVVLKGQSTSLTFNDVGTYGYICGLHPGMKGQIEVVK
jgi:plastocyanin